MTLFADLRLLKEPNGAQVYVDVKGERSMKTLSI
jgi:hypothetical protein